MKKQLFTVLFSICFLLVNAQKASVALPRPKLVVGIVIDQMRWDYIYRYYDRYSEGGFKRFLREGTTCENTYINYLPTYTAVGHSTVYTGSVPAIHGITGNDFIINATGKNVYCAEDSTVQTVGSNSAEGQMSPRNLLVTTITDELRLATNFRSKVIGIALKDRGSIFPAGHTANAAYWFDNATGNWITSTYYMKELPNWLKQFNSSKLPDKYLKQDWNTLYPIATYIQSSADNNRYEGKFKNQSTPTFPIKISEISTGNYDIIRSTPYGNTLTLDMAKAAIEGENLGRNAFTDFLAISCSSTDYVGHKFGINAVEVEDMYLRLDRDLASFFTYLDGKIGKENYTVFLTADHGAGHNAVFLEDNKIPGGFWQSDPLQKELNQQLERSYKVKNLITGFSNYQVHFNDSTIKKNSLDEDALRKTTVKFLSGKPGIAFVIDAKGGTDTPAPQEIKESIINGYNPARAGSIAIILQPGWYTGAPNSTGTTHGSWYKYDTHIPLLWMGWGIRHASITTPVYMTDIAPTLSSLLHVQTPNGSVGKTISAILK